MTLIAHIWTNNFNIIGADTRCLYSDSGITQNDDNVRKLFVGNNFIFGAHGQFLINDNQELTDELEDFVAENGNDTAEQVAHKLLKRIKGLNKELRTGFLVAGRENHLPTAFYVDIYLGRIIYDYLNDTIELSIPSSSFPGTFRFNFETFPQRDHILAHLNNAIQEIIEQENWSWDAVNNISHADWIRILTSFYARAIEDESALTASIGGSFEHVTIRDDGITRSW